MLYDNNSEKIIRLQDVSVKNVALCQILGLAYKNRFETRNY